MKPKIDPRLIVLVVVLSLIVGWYSTSGLKPQWVRILDVFVYGPILIYTALQIEEKWLSILLLIFGSTTIAYNMKNYLEKK